MSKKLAVSNSFSRLQHCAALHCTVAQGCSKLEVQHCVSVSVRGGLALGSWRAGGAARSWKGLTSREDGANRGRRRTRSADPTVWDVENDPGPNNADGLYRERRWSRQCQQQVGVGVGGEARGGRELGDAVEFASRPHPKKRRKAGHLPATVTLQSAKRKAPKAKSKKLQEKARKARPRSSRTPATAPLSYHSTAGPKSIPYSSYLTFTRPRLS